MLLKSHRLSVFLLILGFMLCFSGIKTEAEASIVIDSFTSFDSGATSTGGTLTTSTTGWSISPLTANSPVTVSETGISNVLGGTRFTTAQWTSTVANSTALYNGTYEGVTGYFFLNTGAGASNYGWVETLYDNGGTGLNADFSTESSILVSFDPDHLAFGKDSIMKITLDDSDSSFTIENRWINPDDYVSQPGVLDVEFMLADFTDIDLDDIQSVKFFYEGDYSNDVAFHGISSAVPIPSGVWLLGSGLFGLAGFRRKFKKP